MTMKHEKRLREIAVLAATWLDRVSSADGSGHKDLAERIWEMIRQADAVAKSEADVVTKENTLELMKDGLRPPGRPRRPKRPDPCPLYPEGKEHYECLSHISPDMIQIVATKDQEGASLRFFWDAHEQMTQYDITRDQASYLAQCLDVESKLMAGSGVPIVAEFRPSWFTIDRDMTRPESFTLTFHKSKEAQARFSLACEFAAKIGKSLIEAAKEMRDA